VQEQGGRRCTGKGSRHDNVRAMPGYCVGRPLLVEFSPVTDFREARCRSYDEATCNRGGHCNFLHLMPVSRKLMRRLFDLQKKTHKKKKKKRRSGSRERAEKSLGSPDRKDLISQWNDEADDAAGGGGGGGGGGSPQRKRSRSRSRSPKRDRSPARERSRSPRKD
jgi:splicing factor U2AF subunit